MNSGKILMAIGVVSLIIGIVSRVLVRPVPPIGLEARSFLGLANSCFLLSIALSLSQCKK